MKVVSGGGDVMHSSPASSAEASGVGGRTREDIVDFLGQGLIRGFQWNLYLGRQSGQWEQKSEVNVYPVALATSVTRRYEGVERR